ncbi:MAG: hypothetical protein JO027_14310 [Solirubrobacterales bacterium]|nr:hypothetical protein [Solirubrobacterales bacterium]
MSVLPAPPRRSELSPIRARGRWVAWGLVLQVLGVGIPVVTAIRRAHETGVGGAITHYTIRLVWHEMLRSGADVALIVLGVVLFVAGAVVLARPFVRRTRTLVLAVPFAAVAGLAVFGVLALVCAGLAAAAASAGDADWGSMADLLPGDWFGRRRR